MRLFVFQNKNGHQFAINPDLITALNPDGENDTRVWLSGSGQSTKVNLPFSYMLSAITGEQFAADGVHYLGCDGE